MIPTNYTKRLSRDGYKQSNQTTFQESLSDIQIAKYLTDYVKISNDEIFTVPINTHIRYFSVNPKTKERLFRMGGAITKVGDNKQYVVLSNGKSSWSVQIKDSIFYKKLSPNELREHIINTATEDVNKEFESVKRENEALKKMLKEIKKTTKLEKEKKKINKNI